MKIYFAESSTEAIEPLHRAGVENFLVSFFYQKQTKLIEKILEFNPKANIFFDSGAYSAMTQKQTIDMKEYVEFIKQYSKNLVTIVSLDVIGDQVQTKANYEIMRKMTDIDQKKLIPVFHGREDLEYLDYYCSKSDYVAVGGLVAYRFDQRPLFNMVNHILERIPKGKKVHLFGVTSHPLLMRYGGKLFSVDSSSANRRIVYSASPNVTGMMKFTNSMAYRISVDDAANLQQYAAKRLLQVEREVNDYWSAKGN